MARRTTRTPMVLTVLGIVAMLMLAPITGAAAAEPLPTGTYEVAVSDDVVTVSVSEDGSVAVAGAEDVVVDLEFDEDGRVLDRFTVVDGDAVHVVQLDVAEDGTYTATVSPAESEEGDGVDEGLDGEDVDGDDADGDDADGDDVDGEDVDGEDVEEDEAAGDEGRGEVVSTIAQCAPRGLQARAAGWPSHGTIVRAAASGDPLAAEVVDPETGESTPLEADLSTLEGAEAFCAMVAETVPTAEEVRAARAEARAEAKAEREAARAEARAEREADRADRAAAREEARTERDAARAERADARAERKAERGAQG